MPIKQYFPLSSCLATLPVHHGTALQFSLVWLVRYSSCTTALAYLFRTWVTATLKWECFAFPLVRLNVKGCEVLVQLGYNHCVIE